MKVTVIGGGSFLWTFGIIRQFVESEHLRDVTLMLMDIDAEAVALVRRAGQIYNQSKGSPIGIEASTDLAESLDGAEFVIVCISTGGLDAMEHDIEIPAKYGIYHTVGDTVGPAGWSRAVRNIPVFHRIASVMAEKCPQAWMLNITNPLTPLTRVPQKYFGIKTIGICTGVEELAAALIQHVGLEGKTVDYVVTGINHGSWFTKLHADGVDVLERLRQMGYWRSDDKIPETVYLEDQKIGVYGSRAIFAVWREIGYMPSINDRHAAENWPWCIVSSNGELPFGIERTAIEKRRAAKQARRERLEQIVQSGDAGQTGGLGHGDDPIVPMIESLRGFRSLHMPINYMNVGQIPDAPAGAVVETRGLIDAAGVHPEVSPMPYPVKALVMPHIYRQEALVEIAIDGTFDQLVAMVNSDPLCWNLPLGRCRSMMQELLEANRPYISNPRLLEF